MQIDLTCPVENRGVTVKNNSQTGEPYALFKLFNLSEQVIDSVLMVVRLYDAYGGEMGNIPVKLTELAAEPKSFFATNKAVSLAEFPLISQPEIDRTLPPPRKKTPPPLP